MILRDKENRIWLWGANINQATVDCELGYFLAPVPQKVELYNINLTESIVTVKLPDNIHRSNFNTKGYDLMLLRTE